MGSGERRRGKEEEAKEELKGELLYTMAMAEHGGEFAISSPGALCRYRSHQYCETYSPYFYSAFLSCIFFLL